MADAWGGAWSNAWGISWGYATPPSPPPPPTPPDASVGGGAGPISYETVKRFRDHYTRISEAQDASRKERKAAEQQLRSTLERAFRGDEPEVAEAVAEVLAEVVNLEAKRIDWTPALRRLDLMQSLMQRIEALMQEDARIRDAMQREEEDIEMILLSIW